MACLGLWIELLDDFYLHKLGVSQPINCLGILMRDNLQLLLAHENPTMERVYGAYILCDDFKTSLSV
jgi:hypothetical protein